MKLQHYIIKPIDEEYPRMFDIPPALHSSNTSLANYRTFFRRGSLASYFPISGEGYFLANKDDYLLFSHTYVGYELDTASRTGLLNHVSIIPTKAIMDGQLSLWSLIEAMNEFEKKHGHEEGETERLEVSESEAIENETQKQIVELVELNGALYIADSLLKGDQQKIILRAPNLDESLKICIGLLELLNVKLKIPVPLTFATAIVSKHFRNNFRLYAITRPKKVSGDDWYSMQKGTPEIVKETETNRAIFEAIRKHYMDVLNMDLEA